MRFLNFSLELNKIFLISFLVAMLLGFGKIYNILPVIGTYGLLLLLDRWIKQTPIEMIKFYEWVNVVFTIALNLACWVFYIFTSFVNMSLVLSK